MIRRVSIKNFQSHKDSVIDFGPGVNVIVGESDSGKSAILRAIYWVLYNKPSGDDFRSDWGGDTDVTVDFENGSVRKVKSSSKNLYYLNDQEYKAFGQAVPEPIEKFINMDKVNFQTQLESPFMLSWSSGEVGAYLNQIANLEDIEETVQANKNKINEERQAIKVCLASIQELSSDLATYKDLPSQEKKVSSLEKKIEAFSEIERQEKELLSLIGKAEKLQKYLDEAGEYLKKEKILENLSVRSEKITELEKEYSELNSLIQEAIKQGSSLKKIQKDSEYFQNQLKEEQKNAPEVCPTCGQEVKSEKSRLDFKF